jgi:hypothetical protein
MDYGIFTMVRTNMVAGSPKVHYIGTMIFKNLNSPVVGIT